MRFNVIVIIITDIWISGKKYFINSERKLTKTFNRTKSIVSKRLLYKLNLIINLYRIFIVKVGQHKA